MEKRHNQYIRKLNRILILPLVVLSVVFVVAGYGTVNPQLIGELTGGLLNRARSLYLHTVLAFPVMILLAIHILVQLRFALINWGVKDGVLLSFFVIALGIFMTALFLLMDPRILWTDKVELCGDCWSSGFLRLPLLLPSSCPCQ